MNLLQAIQQRRSVRAYQPQPVEHEKLLRVLEAARLAPSARNMQDWKFIVVQDETTRERLLPAVNNQAFVPSAPVIIVGCATQPDYVMRCGQPSGPIDVAIALEHMALQAVEEGLGTCWIGSFYPDQVKAILDIPDDVVVVELLTLGYPAGNLPESKPREPLESIVAFERWS